jgi:16S rRNA pseudouridine516 synthase
MAKVERVRPMALQDILFSQGFGTRRLCAGLVQQGRVTVEGQVCTDASELFMPVLEEAGATRGLAFTVQGQPWVYAAQAYLMLHKPAGTECSQRASMHPSVYTLLPAPLRQRPRQGQPGVQAVGRLDEDTTGLLLLSDDGAFIHRMTSPRHHVPKLYLARTRHPLDESQLQRLAQGVVLDDDPEPVAAQSARAVQPHVLELVLTEGRYHQVKRMVAAVGNRVDALHRHAIGGLTLDVALAPGQWRWLSPADLALLREPKCPPAPPTAAAAW